MESTAEIEKIRELTGEASLEAGLEAKVSVPLFARFFAKMRAAANASYSTKKTIIESIEPRLSDLIGHCNDLIREVKSRLQESGKKGLIIIIEDLDDLVLQFIDISGGCLRDLFRMIRDAADNAMNHGQTRITHSDYKKSFFRLRRDYENTIAEKWLNNEVIITVEEYYDTLTSLALSETKKVDNTGAALDLRQNLCILGYNDEGWCDLHPVVRSILQERTLIP
ncbi:MAG: hypothetical protein WCK85_06160 [Chlorobium sp.]